MRCRSRPAREASPSACVGAPASGAVELALGGAFRARYVIARDGLMQFLLHPVV